MESGKTKGKETIIYEEGRSNLYTGHNVNSLIKKLNKIGKERENITKKYINQLEGKRGPLYKLIHLFRGADLLDILRDRYLDNLKSQQEVLIEVGKVGIKSHENLNDLEKTIKRARQEGWSINNFIQYVTKRAEVPILEETFPLLERELEMIPRKNLEGQVSETYDTLNNTVAIGKRFVSVLGNCVSFLLEEFKKTAIDYYTFKEFSGPLKVISQTAEEMTRGEKDTVTIRNALLESLKKNGEGIALAIQAMQELKDYRLASDATKTQVEEEVSKIEAKAREFGIIPQKGKGSMKKLEEAVVEG